MSTYNDRMAHLVAQPQMRIRAGVFATLWAPFGAMIMARQTRRLLADMDDRTLADIGIGRGDAMMEAARPMWDLDIV